MTFDAPNEVTEQLDKVVRALSSRWLLALSAASAVVQRWVAGEDLHAASNWVYLHEELEYWAGWLYHRFVLHGDDSWPEECRVASQRVRQTGRPPVKSDAVLLISASTTSTALLLADAAARRGLEVRRLEGPGDLAILAGRPTYWYGGPLAAGRSVNALGIGLLEPQDDWLPRIGRRFTGRRIELATLAEAWALKTSAFVKPPSEKSFPASIYPGGSHVLRAGDGLPPETPALISQVVSLVAEYRLFLLDRQIATGSRYMVYGRLDPAPLAGDSREREVRAFAQTLARHQRFSLPSAVVVDVGLARDPDTGRERWVVVEANMAWFAHCYAADPDRVLDVVLASAGPLANVTEGDFGFLRAWSA
jgi:ATP-grasp domain, R2K clade family 2